MNAMKKTSQHQIDLQNVCHFHDITEQQIKSWCRQIMDKVFDCASGISLTLMDQKQMQQLNCDYRGKDRPTNVLSFEDRWPPQLVEQQGYHFMGDMVICPPVVQQEAQQQRKPLADHWKHMLVHGILHLAGYDHIDEQQAQQMEQLEMAILSDMNVPNPYIERGSNAS